MPRVYLRTCLLFWIAACASASDAQTAAPAPGDLPPPAAYLPDYRSGFTPHHRLLGYFEAVAAASPRVTLESYGETYEGRPLTLAYVSTPENLARLEELRTRHLAGEVTDDPVAVVWLSCSVHGNEAAGSEASPGILHALASAPAGSPLADALAHAVVVLDPSLNPDGYTRYTDDARRRATLRPDVDADTWEHVEPWPGGRTNHYYFDLNRDWVWASQVETQQRLAVYRRWRPHVHADLHEMGRNSSYYFAPAAEPFHRYITDFQRAFQRTIGEAHAEVFDARGWLYYTREVFDLLYPSYGDTYPTFNGAVGMTYEQGGSGRAGRAVERREGDTLTLADRIDHHTATALSTVQVASASAQALVEAAAAFRQQATAAPRGRYVAYGFPAGANTPGRLRALTRLLDLHGIAYATPGAARDLMGLRYATGELATGELAPGDLVVPALQEQGVLAQVLLDPAAEVPDSLTYDITAWSLPTVLGLDGYALEESPGELAPYAPPQIDDASEGSDGAYGFAVPVEDLASWTALAPLLARGAVARYSPRETRLPEAPTLPRGTFFFLARDQRGSDVPSLDALRDSLRTAGIAPVPLRGGLVEEGYDLGSDRVTRIAGPRVALLQGDELDANAFGHVWHFFERRLRYPVSILPLGRVGAADLSRYDVIVATDGATPPAGDAADDLTAWVRAGGRLVLLEGAAEAFGAQSGYAFAEAEESATLVTGDAAPDPMRPYAQRERDGISDNVPGALVAAEVDTTHPIGFGLGESFFVLRTADRDWDFLAEGANVIGLRRNPEVRGFIGANARERLDETLAVGVQAMGRGDVVYAADNLAYRGFWEHGMQVLANAVFYR